MEQRTFHLEGRLWRSGACLSRGEWAGDRDSSRLLSWQRARRFQPAGMRPPPEEAGPRLEALLRAAAVHPVEALPADGPAWEVGFRSGQLSMITFHHGRASQTFSGALGALEEIADVEGTPFGGLLLLDRIIRAMSDGALTLPAISAALPWAWFDPSIARGWEAALAEDEQRRSRQLTRAPIVEAALDAPDGEVVVLPRLGPARRVALPAVNLRSDAEVEISTGWLRLPGLVAWRLEDALAEDAPPVRLEMWEQALRLDAARRPRRSWWQWWR